MHYNYAPNNKVLLNNKYIKLSKIENLMQSFLNFLNTIFNRQISLKAWNVYKIEYLKSFLFIITKTKYHKKNKL